MCSCYFEDLIRTMTFEVGALTAVGGLLVSLTMTWDLRVRRGSGDADLMTIDNV